MLVGTSTISVVSRQSLDSSGPILERRVPLLVSVVPCSCLSLLQAVSSMDSSAPPLERGVVLLVSLVVPC